MKQMEYIAEPKRTILEEGTYKGVKFAIISQGIHPCAYVENIVHATGYYDRVLDNVIVHGGFTYCGTNYWGDKGTCYLGWSYDHASDFSGHYLRGNGLPFAGKGWTTEEILDEVRSVIDQLLKVIEVGSENTPLIDIIKAGSLVELYGDSDFRQICTDECEIVDDVLYLNEDPQDDVNLRYVSKVWNLDEHGNYILVWQRPEEGVDQ